MHDVFLGPSTPGHEAEGREDGDPKTRDSAAALCPTSPAMERDLEAANRESAT